MCMFFGMSGLIFSENSKKCFEILSVAPVGITSSLHCKCSEQ